jgi:SMP-30/Gluconolactonase/LRE-like region
MRRALAVGLVLGALSGAQAAHAAAPAPDPCAAWSDKVVADGLGSLENIEFDGLGGLILSASDQDAIARLGRDGKLTHLVDDVTSPGGLRVRRGVLFFNAGDAIANGLNDTPNGTIERYDFRTRRHTVYARNIVMPNGLLFLPNGDALTSRDIGGPPAIYLIPRSDPTHPRGWTQTDDNNGMAIDPTGKYVYAVQTFKFESPVLRIPIADPSKAQVLAGAGQAKGLDDMTIDRDGVLYIAANGSGEIIRLDPRTKQSCVIAGGASNGWRNTSAVKFGCGPGWRSDHLFAVGFDGVVHELTPPATKSPARGICAGRLRPGTGPNHARDGRHWKHGHAAR